MTALLLLVLALMTVFIIAMVALAIWAGRRAGIPLTGDPRRPELSDEENQERIRAQAWACAGVFMAIVSIAAALIFLVR